MPRNPQKEAFWVITILPQSRPSYFAIRRIATGFRILGNPEAIQMDCAPIGLDVAIASGLRIEASGWSPETGFSRSSQPYRNRVDNISQSCGLWMDCRFNAILTQFRRLASGLQPNAIDRPGIALPSQSDRNQSRNPRSRLFRLFAILPQSINSILQSCGLWINRISKAILTI